LQAPKIFSGCQVPKAASLLTTMATLSTAQKAVIAAQVEYMRGEYEKPLDATVVDRLSPMHAEFGFDSEILFREGLRDKPFTTLLQAYVATTVIVGSVPTNVAWVLEYLDGNYEKPLDEAVAKTLLPNFRIAGQAYAPWTSDIQILEDLRDAPYSAFLRLIVLLAA